MVSMSVTYVGDLRCTAIHEPSGDTLATDAPRDNHGKGEHFSPTDLLATALATCMGTYVGLLARRHGWALDGTTLRVEKHMVADPLRRVGRLDVAVVIPQAMADDDVATLREGLLTCPVKLSLAATIDVTLAISVAS